MGKFDGSSSGFGMQYVVGGILIVAAVALFGFMGVMNFNSGPSLDKVTFCPDKIDSVTAVLIDASDEISPVQREDIQNRLDALKESLPRHGRIDLYAMGQEKDGLIRPLFSMCNPGTGEGASALTENAKLMKRRFTRDFSDKLDAELLKVLVVKEQAQSPIMEAVKAVAVQSFGSSAASQATEKTLVIVSDMIHFAGPYNQYKDGRTFEDFSKTEYYKQVRTELRGVMVNLLYVRRPTARNVQGVPHRTFWEHFFRGSGGRVSYFAPI